MAALRDATPEQRVQFLKALDIFGSEAHRAGVDLLKKIDQGTPIQYPSEAPDSQHAAKVAALAIPPIGKILECLLKCAPKIPNWGAFAACVLTCIVGG